MICAHDAAFCVAYSVVIAAGVRTKSHPTKQTKSKQTKRSPRKVTKRSPRKVTKRLLFSLPPPWKLLDLTHPDPLCLSRLTTLNPCQRHDMEAEPELAEPLTANRKSIGAALAQENQRWMHQFSLIDEQNNRRGVEFTATETFRERDGRRLVVRQFTKKRTRSSPAPTTSSGHAHPAPTRARNTRNMQNNRPRFDSLRRVRDSAVQKFRRAKNTTVSKLRPAMNTTVSKLRPAMNTTVNILRSATNTTVSILRGVGNGVDRLIPQSSYVLAGINVALAIAIVYTNTRAAHYQALLANPPAE
jgi:hypothetical protein